MNKKLLGGFMRIIYCSNISEGMAFLLQNLIEYDSKDKRYKFKLWKYYTNDNYSISFSWSL